jgi:hypothetical protein
MKFFHAVLAVVVLFGALGARPGASFGGPGDPRLVNGVVEWPRVVSNEPFIVVRGDDGVLYYVGITTARRDAALTGGGRVAILGLEGRSAHEVTALGIGAGESVEAAIANLQGARPAPTAAAPVTPPTPTFVATPPAAPAVAAPAHASTPPATSAALVPAPATGAAVATPAPATPNAAMAPPAPNTPPVNGSAAAIAAPNTNGAPTPAAAAPSAKSLAPSPAPAGSAPAATSPAPAVTPPATGVITHPNVISVPMPPASRGNSSAPTPPPAPSPAKRPAIEVIATPTPAAVPASTTDDRRWTEVSGVVESIVGRTLVLRAPEGRVAVDVSGLSGNLERMVTPGATVRVYGVPVEMRFKALGFFDPGPGTRP